VQIQATKIFVASYHEPRCPKCNNTFIEGEATVEGFHADCWADIHLSEHNTEIFLEWVSGVE
jgi:hypothetical protein